MNRGPGGMGGKPPKAKNFKQSISKIFSYLGKYKIFIIIAIVFACIASIITISGPSFIQDITETIGAGLGTSIDTSEVTRLGLILAVLYVAALILGYSQSFIMTTISQRTSQSLRKDLTEKINKLPLGYFDTRSHGDTLSLVSNDVDSIANGLNQSLSPLISGLLLFFGAIIMMFVTNWIMAIAGILASLIGFVLMMIIMKNSQKFFGVQQKQLALVNGHIEEIFAGHNVVKAYNAEAKSAKEFKQINHELYDSAWKSQFFSGMMMPIMQFIGNFSYVVVCVVGAILVVEKGLNISVIVAFMIYIRLFSQPLGTIAQSMSSLQTVAAASERVFDFLEAPVLSFEEVEFAGEEKISGNVEFRNVHFGYNPEKIIIKDFSANVKAGQKVAIVGPTGAGKTTLVNLIMRFYELNSGDILIDGTSIKEIPHHKLHTLFSMVLQDTWLFEGTIKENIIYNKEDITDEEVIKVCKKIGIHHVIMSQPNGYDTILNDKVNFSAGQKQLLTIARSMIKDSELLILDEATSSVDTRTEILIQKAMDELAKGKTSFIIAHRLSTIKNSDLILVMKDGDIIESGTHDELIELNGFYATLYNSQFESVDEALGINQDN